MTSSYGLGFKGMMFLLVVLFNGLCCEIVEGNNSTSRSSYKFLDVKTKIDHLKKNAVKSIKSEDGDVIDCIDVYKQPAFDHPALKKHVIQMTPSFDPMVEDTTTTTTRRDKNKETSMSQLWHKSGNCPKGTIPVRRVQENLLHKAGSIKDYGRKKYQSNLNLENHTLGILHTEGFSYLGAKGDIKVWNPNVESNDEYSTSQVALKNGPYYDFESVEAGWAVNPSVYGDRQTRLFGYWTVDASKKTGCFDLTCPGFIQTSNEVALGAAIYPISKPQGLPYEITIYIFKDPKTDNWWLQYEDQFNIGYWPRDLFTILTHTAETVQWGGEVYSTKLGVTPHTATAMGNGQFPDPISGDSGCVTRMRILENSLILKFPEWVSTYSDEWDCYGATYLGDYVDDPEFYYGGPGRSERCP